jgi:acetyl/propionyl-CoA carboxylase alpha subunit
MHCRERRCPGVADRGRSESFARNTDYPHEVSAEATPAGLLLTVGGRTSQARIALAASVTWAHVNGGVYTLSELSPARLQANSGSADSTVRSPMPGSVVAVHVTEGSAVQKGEPLLAVEAMKMEHSLTAPASGTVHVSVGVGDQVAVKQELASCTRTTSHDPNGSAPQPPYDHRICKPRLGGTPTPQGD